MTQEQAIPIRATRHWVEQVVIGYQLCPFARLPFQQDRIRYVLASAQDVAGLREMFLEECRRLESHPPEEISTTLLILTEMGKDFMEYWDLVSLAEDWLDQAGYTGIFQVASFHPDYIFAEADTQAAQNYTNRSPWPMLHLLREEELEAAIDHHPDIEAVPQRNIELMERKGRSHWRGLLQKIIGQAQSQ